MNNLTLSRGQAQALAKLIRAQLSAYDEATGARPQARRHRIAEPFTGADLDLIEPLARVLESMAGP